MLQVTIENHKGRQLTLTRNEAVYQVYEVDGLFPPKASISMSENIGDGSMITNSRISNRNIVIYIQINGDVESNRLKLYQYAQTGKKIKLYFTTTSKNVWIEGYVESVETENFSMKTVCQISVICPEPFFKDIKETINTLNTVIGNFYFPFYTEEPIPFSTYEQVRILNLLNTGNIKSGMTIEFFANNTLINPIIYNKVTQEYLGFGDENRPFTMLESDRIIVTTYQNQKKATLIRNAVETNIFNSLKQGSTFLQLDSGDNEFAFSADEGIEALEIKFKHHSYYEGI